MSNKNRNNGKNRSKTRTLDFNTVERPSLRLIMQDDAHTEILVITPTEGLVEELEHIRPNFEAMITNKEKLDIQALYEFAAKVINCNRSFRDCDRRRARWQVPHESREPCHLLRRLCGFYQVSNELKN